MIPIIFALLGLTFGSFGSVLIVRLPARQSIRGRSRCPRCRHLLSVYDLLPLLGYLLCRGHCRYCRKPISFLYPFVELASAGLFILALFLASTITTALLLALSLWLLLLTVLVDMRTSTIPDSLSLTLIAFAIALGLARGHPSTSLGASGLEIAGPLLFFLFFGGQWLLSHGRWMGSGDILLGLGIGFLVSDTARSLLLLALAYVLGAAVAVFLLITKRATRKSSVPFGPFLAVATVLTLVFGERVLGMLILGLR
jgi:prepilin signal peptidase PulO-like enzyme (type II secretory pathway)